jgi:hypothetical protein
MHEAPKRKGKQPLLPSSGPRAQAEPILTGYREKSKTYLALLDAYIVGWKFVITTEGRCGIAPPGVLPGDIVGILSGSNVPFIVREGLGPGFGNFIVAECYIDGLMFREAVKDLKAGKRIENTFSVS